MVYGSGTGSICYDQGLDEHSSPSHKKHSKIKENGLSSQNFLRLRRAYEGLQPVSGTPPL